jgi:Ca-activated chloride channel family protein
MKPVFWKVVVALAGLLLLAAVAGLLFFSGAGGVSGGAEAGMMPTPPPVATEEPFEIVEQMFLRKRYTEARDAINRMDQSDPQVAALKLTIDSTIESNDLLLKGKILEAGYAIQRIKGTYEPAKPVIELRDKINWERESKARESSQRAEMDFQAGRYDSARKFYDEADQLKPAFEGASGDARLLAMATPAPAAMPESWPPTTFGRALAPPRGVQESVERGSSSRQGPRPSSQALPIGDPYSATFYEPTEPAPFIDAQDDKLSTFAIDVDTASYTIARKYLLDGHLPNPNSVRVEEFVNFFDQGVEPPSDGRAFAIRLDGAASPFRRGSWLMRAVIRGREVPESERKDLSLVFVIDVSGSMSSGNRLETVKQSLQLLVERLRASDRVGIVAYHTTAFIVLEPVGGSQKADILQAIDSLRPLSSTNVEAGLTLGYDIALRMAGGPSRETRVILCSDGVANTGQTKPEAILERVRGHVSEGVTLTAIGVGMGNYNDALLEKLANSGNGLYHYVDDLAEARRVFVDNMTGALQTIARDAKIQVEFNPETVDRWRLLGYENRAVADRDFRNDAIDAGEVGAGHSVAALYELKLNDAFEGASWRLATVRVRWQDPDSGEVIEMEREFSRHDFAQAFAQAAPRLQLAATVAEFAELLRRSPWTRGNTVERLAPLARRVAGLLSEDADAGEFSYLVETAARRFNDAANQGQPGLGLPSAEARLLSEVARLYKLANDALDRAAEYCRQEQFAEAAQLVDSVRAEFNASTDPEAVEKARTYRRQLDDYFYYSTMMDFYQKGDAVQASSFYTNLSSEFIEQYNLPKRMETMLQVGELSQKAVLERSRDLAEQVLQKETNPRNAYHRQMSALKAELDQEKRERSAKLLALGEEFAAQEKYEDALKAFFESRKADEQFFDPTRRHGDMASILLRKTHQLPFTGEFLAEKRRIYNLIVDNSFLEDSVYPQATNLLKRLANQRARELVALGEELAAQEKHEEALRAFFQARQADSECAEAKQRHQEVANFLLRKTHIHIYASDYMIKKRPIYNLIIENSFPEDSVHIQAANLLKKLDG